MSGMEMENDTLTHTERAAQLDQLANEAEARNARRVAEQMDQSDCALSFWATDLNAQKYRLQAEIERQGGLWEFDGLFDRETGKRLPAKLIRGRYGLCWAWVDRDGQFTGIFEPYALTARQERNLAHKGLIQQDEMVRAKAVIRGSGTGLGSLTSCRVMAVRLDGGVPPEAFD